MTNDYDLNAHTPEYLRRVPFANMIYVGDGLTDVPCMKMTKLKGGCSIVVYAPGGQRASRTKMLLQRRADFALPADYGGGRADGGDAWALSCARCAPGTIWTWCTPRRPGRPGRACSARAENPPGGLAG